MNILQATLVSNAVTILSSDSLRDRMIHAFFNTLIGMLTVFAVLILCIFLISLLKFIPRIQEKFSKREKTDTTIEESIAQVESQVEGIKEEYIDDGELVAVIMAAIHASMEEAYEIPLDKDALVVRSIRKIK